MLVTVRGGLPRADDGAPRAEPSTDTPPAVVEAAAILVVDDEPSMRLLARRVLERRGHRVVEAEDGEAALSTSGSWGRRS